MILKEATGAVRPDLEKLGRAKAGFEIKPESGRFLEPGRGFRFPTRCGAWCREVSLQLGGGWDAALTDFAQELASRSPTFTAVQFNQDARSVRSGLR